MKTIKVYSTPTCPYCHLLKEFLKQNKIKFADYDVSKDVSKAKEMIEKTHQRGVPVIDIDGEVVIGFDKERITKILGIGDSGKNSGEEYDVAIIGTGVVGLTAAIYCGRLKLKTIVLGKEQGGTITKTHVVENYPGFKKISGIDLAEKILEHAKEYDVEIKYDEVKKISWNKKECFKVETKKEEYHAKTILFSTGSEWKKLKVPGEEEFRNKGVHYCALCDAPLYKNKTIAVVGGGDSAIKEALLLTKYAKKVYIIARSKLKGEPVNHDLAIKNKKIEILENTEVKEIKGERVVKSVTLNKIYNGIKELALDGVFVDIGHISMTELAVPLGVKVDKEKRIIIDRDSMTNKTAVYAAGDCTDTKHKQALTGMGEAVKAVYSIYEYLTKGDIICR